MQTSNGQRASIQQMNIMDDVSSQKVEDSKFPKLSERVRYLKESQEGTDDMSDIVEGYLKSRSLSRLFQRMSSKNQMNSSCHQQDDPRVR